MLFPNRLFTATLIAKSPKSRTLRIPNQTQPDSAVTRLHTPSSSRHLPPQRLSTLFPLPDQPYQGWQNVLLCLQDDPLTQLARPPPRRLFQFTVTATCRDGFSMMLRDTRLEHKLLKNAVRDFRISISGWRNASGAPEILDNRFIGTNTTYLTFTMNTILSESSNLI